MAFTAPIRTGGQSIDRVLQVGLPVLLVFERKSCAPCRQLDPALARLAAEYAGRALVARVDADDDRALAERYGVRSLPGLVFVKDGAPVAQADGAAPEDGLRAWLKHLTSGGGRPPLPSGPSEPLAAGAKAGGGPRETGRAAPGGGAAHGAGPRAVGDADFTSVVEGSAQPVLVDFWAPWCGPCRAVAPSVERLAQEFAGRALVVKLNVDDNPRTAQRFGITGIPALYIFKGGRVVERLVGAQPYPALRQALARHAG